MKIAVCLWTFTFAGAGQVAAAPDFVAVDFTRGEPTVALRAAHDAKVLKPDLHGLPVETTGPDPQLELPVWRPSEGPNWCYLRVRAEQPGLWQLFYTQPAQERCSVRFWVAKETVRDVWIPLPAAASAGLLRLDPPGIGKAGAAAKVWIQRLELAADVVVRPFRPAATKEQLVLGMERPPATVHPSLAGVKLQVWEAAPYQTLAQAEAGTPFCEWAQGDATTHERPRTSDGGDRAYDRYFAAAAQPSGGAEGGTAYWSLPQAVTLQADAIPQAPALPEPKSKKGLQVQMLDDALALGVQHAALNVDLAQLFDPAKAAKLSPEFVAGEEVPLDEKRIAGLPVKPLSDAGARVSLILLVYPSGRPELDRILLHPGAAPDGPGKPAAWNLDSPRSVRWLTAALEALAQRYAGTDPSHGRAVQWIVGNEVNSHSAWHSLGKAGSIDVAAQYERETRLAQTALSKHGNRGRAYLSLDHFWAQPMSGDPTACLPGKELLTLFHGLARGAGDLPWQVAYHPYPENLFNARFWEDKSPTDTFDSPRITFKNLDVLPRFLDQPDWRFDGRPRRVVLSEQGFHSPPGEEGELLQAAAYCAAYRRVEGLPGIDAFILHRHVDHAGEGGLLLGLWTFKPGTVATPDRRKKIYAVFKAADQPGWEEAFRFALPIVGRERWD